MTSITPLSLSYYEPSKDKNLCSITERSHPESMPNFDDSVINLEKFDQDILKAFSFKTMEKAHDTLLASHQQLVLSKGPKSSNTKQTFSSISQYEQFTNSLKEKEKKISAWMNTGVFMKPVELNSTFMSDKSLKSSDNSSKKNHKEKEIELSIEYVCSFNMPPTLAASHHSMLSLQALGQFRQIKTLETACGFVDVFGSHFINCKYNLGGFYIEDSNIVRNENTRQQKDDDSKSGSVSAGVNMMVVGTDGKYSSKNSNSDKTKSSFNISNVKSREDFLEKFFPSIYNSKILDEIFKSGLTKILDITEQQSELDDQVQFCFRLKENKTLNRSQLENNFRNAFTPIWKLIKPDQRTWLQYNLVTIMCLFYEENFFFNMEFRSVLNETGFVDSYLEALKDYFFRVLKKTEFSINEMFHDYHEWQRRIERIFIKELNNPVHFTNLQMCADNQIRYLNKNYNLLRFYIENENKFLYLLFYSLELLIAFPREWREKLQFLKKIGDQDRSHNKCAIVDYDQCPEFRDKSFYNTICLKQYFKATNEFKDFEMKHEDIQNEDI